MNVQVRARITAFFGPSITSWRALLWFYPIGIALILITLPRDGRVGLTDGRWWITALAAQTTLVIVVRLSSYAFHRTRLGNSSVTARALIVISGGVLRGIVVALMITWLTPPQAPEGVVPLRIANSAVICCLWLGFIGLLIQAGRDYREQYRTLLARAVALHRVESDSDVRVDKQLLERWASVQVAMRETSERIRRELGDHERIPTAADLAAAAAVASEAVTADVRPTSHGLWSTQAPEPPRLRAGALIWDSISTWHLPIRDIAVILCAISFVGASIRAGFLIGMCFAALYVIACLTLMWLSNVLAQRSPGALVGIATLFLLPWILLGLAIAIGQGVLHADADNGGAAVAAGSASIVAFGLLLLNKVAGERRELLDALQARIDHSVVVIVARQELARETDQEVGVFLHHSIQSEFSALALRLGEAAVHGDDQRRVEARTEALERILRIQDAAPSWSHELTGPGRIHDIVRAWEGIARIEMTISPAESGTPHQWRAIARAVEEAIANAIRSGRASHIRVAITSKDSALMLEVVDNGVPAVDLARMNPGLGTAWLESIAPGSWSLTREDSTTVLRVEVS